MRKILSLAIVLAGCISAFSQDTRHLPDDELKLRDSLEADASFLVAGCNLPGQPATLQMTHVRSRIFDLLASGGGSIKAKGVCGTVEGDPMTSYLMLENGKAKIVFDASRDQYAGEWHVTTYTCKKLVAGRYFWSKDKNTMIFTEVAEKKGLGGDRPYFQCQTDKGPVMF